MFKDLMGDDFSVSLLGVLLLIVLLLFISAMISFDMKRTLVKQLNNIKNLDRSDFNISSNDIIIKRHIDTLITDEKSFRGFSGEKYYHISLNVTANKEGYEYIKDNFHKENVVVSYEDYKAYKDFISDFDCLELKASELLICLNKDIGSKCGFPNGKNFHTLRIEVPHLCSKEPFSDDDIDAIITTIKEELAISINNKIKELSSWNK